ncbi:MAG: hypothetical protein OEU36_22970 [Gammaproteobacteria bacterium]|nr:hypothetical protein [Gammaproteobacteria bacterium]
MERRKQKARQDKRADRQSETMDNSRLTSRNLSIIGGVSGQCQSELTLFIVLLKLSGVNQRCNNFVERRS